MCHNPPEILPMITPSSAPLPPPGPLTLAAVTPRTLHLTWQPSAGATQYLVQYLLAASTGEEQKREVRGREGEAGWGRWRGSV